MAEKRAAYSELQSLVDRVSLSDLVEGSARKGIGFTPMRKLEPELNPYHNDGISISAKHEYVNPTGSLKDRSASGMLDYYLREGQGLNAKSISIATSGNFFESVLYCLKSDGITDKKLICIVEERTYQENRGYYEQDFGIPVEFQREVGARCPLTDAFRGREVGALLKRKFETELVLNQHNDVANSLGQVPMGMEMVKDTGGDFTHFVSGIGTGGHLYGVGYALSRSVPAFELIGVMPEDNLKVDENGQYIGHHQIGLRSKSEVGNMIMPRLALDACAGVVFDVSDYNAFAYMRKLWKTGIPSGPSGGANYYSSLKMAERLKERGERGAIVTVIPDSLEPYAVPNGLFERSYEEIMAERFEPAEVHGLIDMTMKEREKHKAYVMSNGSDLTKRIL